MNCLMTLNPKIFCKNRITAHLLWFCLVLGFSPLAASATVVGQDTAIVRVSVVNAMPPVDRVTLLQGPAFTTPVNKSVEFHYTQIPGILFWAGLGNTWEVYLYFENVADQIRNENGGGGPLEVGFGWELDPDSSDFVPPEDSNWHQDEGTYRRVFLESQISSDPDIPPLAEGASGKFENPGSRPFVIAIRMEGSEDLGQYQGTFTFDLRHKL